MVYCKSSHRSGEFLMICTLKSATLAAALTLAAFAPVAQAEPLLPPISTVEVQYLDSVSAAEGQRVLGKPELAHRVDDKINFFATDMNCALYAANPAAYPDVEPRVRLAAMGVDIVHRFPRGIRDRALGPLMVGDPAKFAVPYKGATYAFAERATMLAFKANPEKYMLPVGGYCLGAMSADRVTPGMLLEATLYYVAQKEIWAAFGSPNGPAAWAELTSAERIARFNAAVANHLRRMGGAPAVGRIALAN